LVWARDTESESASTSRSRIKAFMVVEEVGVGGSPSLEEEAKGKERSEPRGRELSLRTDGAVAKIIIGLGWSTS
jgi:hypothetical protein